VSVGAGPLHRSPAGDRLAAAVATTQGVAVAAVAGVDLTKTLTGRPADRAAALLIAGLALVAAAAFGVLARALLHRRGWARSPLLVLELLALPIAWGLAQNRLWWYAVLVGAPAVLVVAALVAGAVAPSERA